MNGRIMENLIERSTEHFDQQTYTNNTLVCIKGVLCICVVFMHLKFPGIFGDILWYAFGFAVPIFYMISGYFAFGCTNKIIIKRTLKISRIFMCSYVMYFIYNVCIHIRSQDVLIWLKDNYNVRSFILLVFFLTVDFAKPLWYLIGMIETYLFWIFLRKYISEMKILKALPFLFIAQIFWISFCMTNNMEWYLRNSFFLRSCPWFMLGFLINQNYSKVLLIKNTSLCVCIIAGVIISLVPVMMNTYIKFNSGGYIPLAFGIFVLALKYPNIKGKILRVVGQNLSLNIYVFHEMVGDIYRRCANRSDLINNNSAFFLWSYPLVSLAITVIGSYIIYKLAKNVKVLKDDKLITS